MNQTAVVIGVGGQIGTAVARQLLSDGWEVRGLDSGNSVLPDDLSAVRLSVGDRNDDEMLRAVLADGADGVVDTIAYNSGHARQLLRFADVTGALAVISSIAVYADARGASIGNGSPDWPGPVTEDQALVPATDETYGGAKVMLEEILFQANLMPVSALRPGAVCGPNSRHLREWWVIKRVLDQRRILPLKYGGRSQFHPSSTVNIAALALHCLRLAGSRALNVADPDCPTVREIAVFGAAAMEHEWQLILLDDDESDGPVGETPWTDRHQFVLNTSLAETIGYEPRTTYKDAMPGLIESALQETAGRAWQEVYPDLAAYAESMFDYATEDEVVLRGKRAAPPGTGPGDN